MTEPRASAFRWFLGLVRPYALSLSVVALAFVVSGAVSLAVPSVAGGVVNSALEKRLPDLERVIGGLIGLFFLSAVLRYVESRILRATAASLLLELRVRLHGHLLGLAPGFFEGQRTGDLLSRLGADVDQIAGALTGQLVSSLQQTLVLVGALAILFWMHAGLTLFMLLAVPPVIVAAVLFGTRLEKLSEAEREAAATANVAAEESLSGIRTVQAFAREPEERVRYRDRLEKAREVALRAARTWGAFGSVVSFLAFTAVALVIGRGGQLVIRGELDAGQLTSFLLYTITVATSVGGLTDFYASLKSAAGATARVRDLLDTESKIVDPPEPKPLERARGRFELVGASFVYPPAPPPAPPEEAAAGWRRRGRRGPPPPPPSPPAAPVAAVAAAEPRRALDRIDLTIEPGRCVALVGPSGAGKSTLASLLLRFHDPTEGVVRLDGEDLRAYRVRDVRAAIGLVPQEVLLFGGSVAENIRYGKPGATDAEVEAAARAAQAHDFVSRLPQSYASLVGERGVKLSAGERQRIAIARVFLKDPGVVILDEATSALDAESEHLVQRAFDRLLEGRTTVVIAHRLATVKRAHEVLVLERGALVERGTHDELFRAGGLYRRFCELSMLGPEVATGEASGPAPAVSVPALAAPVASPPALTTAAVAAVAPDARQEAPA